jgi:hypothetical protein
LKTSSVMTTAWGQRRAGRGGFFVLALALVAAPGARTETPLPTINGQIRPAVFSNGDGSAVTGGLDGTGRTRSWRDLGHIRWTTWSTMEAVGFGVYWIRCGNYRGCPRAYILQSRRIHRIRATRPVNGVFTHVQDGQDCWLWRSAIGYFPVSCDTWRP